MGKPADLVSRLKSAVSAPPPAAPSVEYSAWSDAGEVPSEAQARRAGAAALSRSQLYRAPTVEELREQQEQQNVLAAAQEQQILARRRS